MKIGGKVLYEGQVATVINEVRPKCRCKGEGYYLLEVEGEGTKKVSLTTVLEPYTPLTMANQKLESHKF